jgi:hypothetical protein
MGRKKGMPKKDFKIFTRILANSATRKEGDFLPALNGGVSAACFL